MKSLVSLVGAASLVVASALAQAEGGSASPSAQGTPSGQGAQSGKSMPPGQGAPAGTGDASGQAPSQSPSQSQSSGTDAQQKAQDAQQKAREAQQKAPDDTGRNRMREQGKAEADDQSNDSGDLELTARLRRAITDDDTLSVNAHNIKIVTKGGKVTLRGPVDSQAEKRKVEALARKAAAGRNVTSELEVKPQQ
ncbi:MAG TPA: BON domain-containing protein [Moraxellaceae bacterium]|nr:BON domain-containing protein [Moraxellaceae bacterium]